MPHPLNNLVGPLLTDMYQLTMAYAYWNAGRHNEHAAFELFFRKNPFQVRPDRDRARAAGASRK